MSKSYSLTVLKGLESGQTFRLDRLKAALGRHAGQNDIVLRDPYISSKHAQIIYKAGRFFIEDLGSTNKTFINGVALIPGKPVVLSDGMEFILGETELRFNYKPKFTQPGPRKKKVAGKKYNRIVRMIQNFDVKNYIRYTPIILGVVIWAVVVIIFWIFTMAVNR
jgi:pSer/pThr/pTyr-binding forkhead associated (FHA) protein